MSALGRTPCRQFVRLLSSSCKSHHLKLTPTCDKSNVSVRFAPRSIQIESSVINSRRFLFTNKTEEVVKDASTGEEEAKVSENEKKLEEEVKKLTENNAELLDKYKRSLADFENLRNRMNKQVADSKKFGIQGFCKDLLEVADVLNKAVAGVPQEALQTESQYLKDVYEGLRLTESQLLKVFERHGLVQENPLNEKFDPNKHDALFTIPNPSVEPNIVLDVQKIGYILHGRTIRPAMVGVSKK